MTEDAQPMNEAPRTPENGNSNMSDTDSRPPRLMITKMELENFKSYAGVREIGPFHQCFSSVVGPNGSGKSNVIDAMLFVFGKRAKKLRLNRVSELIHKSDAVKDNPPTAARVSVFFQEIVDDPDGKSYEPVPNTETVVTRVARKDNSSSYKLNGKNCQFRDVASFLDSKGIDLDNNRFLILQGEVEMISMMPPKGKTESDEGLLEYLEDIIGSSKFVEQTNEVATQVESLTEKRQEKLQRVKAVEKEKESLHSAKQEAEALLGKEREIRRNKNILFQLNELQCQRENDKIEHQMETVNEKLAAEQEKLSSANERVKEIESGLSEQRKAHEKVFEELTKTKEEFAAYERRDIKLREEIKHEKARRKKLQAKIKTADDKETKALAKTKASEEAIPQLETRIEELTEEKGIEDKKLASMQENIKEETQTLRGELEQKTQELAPVKQELAVFQASLETAETEVKLLEDSTKRARDRLREAEEELENLDETESSKKQTLKDAQGELKESNQRIKQAEKEQSMLLEKESQLVKRNRDLIARSEEAKAALQVKSGGRSHVVQKLLKAARKGGALANAGILGRLGDLASISPEYDVAISTACGMLDHIVVQTTAGAQKCLQYLREKNIGRANFIPLDKMKKGAHDRAVETPEGSPLLFELITPSNFAVTPAIFLAVGRTLVAPDLDTAKRWAYDFSKRWRVVTVEGELIEVSGTMAGGGKTQRKGGMKLSSGAQSTHKNADVDDTMSMDLQKLEEELEKSQNLLNECKSTRKSLQTEVKTLKASIKKLGVSLPKLEMEVKGFDTTREELTKLIPKLRNQCDLSDKDAKKLAKLEDKVNKCKSNMSSCASSAEKLEEEVTLLQKKILDAGGPAFKKQKKLCEKLVDNFDSCEKELKSAKVAITSSEKIIEKARNSKEAAEKEVEECADLIKEKQEDHKKLEADALKVMEAYETVKKVEDEQRRALETVVQECDDLKKGHSEIKCIEVELFGQLSVMKKQSEASSNKREHWVDELDKLRKVAEDEDEFDVSDDEEEADEQSTEESSILDDNSALENVAPQKRSSRKDTLAVFSPEALDKYSKNTVKEDISVLENERNAIAKNANMSAIAEYRKKEADYLSRVAELDEVTEERNAVRKTHDDLRRQRLEMFMDGFGQITLKLKEMYQMITLGGDAELELVDSLDPFSEGIVFSVRPPKKSWKNISNLSGGEKTLSSLALVFALHHFKPTPLYVMDEIDAALDFKNVSIVANYIKERTKNAQFIIISLRNNMFELADRLVGIYKTNNCTKSVTVNPLAFGVQGQQDGFVPTTPALTDRSNAAKRLHSAAKSVDRSVALRLAEAAS